MVGTLTVQQAAVEWEAALASHEEALARQNTAIRLGADRGQFDEVIEITRLQLDLASAKLRDAIQLDGGGGRLALWRSRPSITVARCRVSIGATR